MNRDSAETIALQALGWVAADPEVASDFLGAAGMEAGDLRAAAGSPDFLGAVMDYLLGDDARVIAFATQAGIAPEQVLQVRAALPGGDLPHWT